MLIFWFLILFCIVIWLQNSHSCNTDWKQQLRTPDHKFSKVSMKSTERSHVQWLACLCPRSVQQVEGNYPYAKISLCEYTAIPRLIKEMSRKGPKSWPGQKKVGEISQSTYLSFCFLSPCPNQWIFSPFEWLLFSYIQKCTFLFF